MGGGDPQYVQRQACQGWSGTPVIHLGLVSPPALWSATWQVVAVLRCCPACYIPGITSHSRQQNGRREKGGRGGLLSLKKSVKCFHLATWMHLQSKRWWPPSEAQSTGFADERREGLNIEATENLDPNTKELRKTSCLLSTKL